MVDRGDRDRVRPGVPRARLAPRCYTRYRSVCVRLARGFTVPGAANSACYDPPMRYPLRFHVLLLPNVGWAELKARVVRLEELGFEVAALADHFVDWTNPAAPWFEAWTALAAIAEATRTHPAVDRRHPDPAAQPGDAGPPGAHARSHLQRPDRARSGHGADHRSVVRDGRIAELGAGGARRALRGVRRSGRPAAVRRRSPPTRGAITRSTARS